MGERRTSLGNPDHLVTVRQGERRNIRCRAPPRPGPPPHSGDLQDSWVNDVTLHCAFIRSPPKTESGNPRVPEGIAAGLIQKTAHRRLRLFRAGIGNSFAKSPTANIPWLGGPYAFCCKYSTLPSQCTSCHRRQSRVSLNRLNFGEQVAGHGSWSGDWEDFKTNCRQIPK